MPIKPNREYRSVDSFVFTEEQDSAQLILRGKPVVFDTPTCLFEYDGVKYCEIIDRNAFVGCDTSDFIFNYNHGGRVYARNRNGSVKYNISSGQFDFEAFLNAEDEGHRQLYRDIKTGLIDKMSFSFSVDCGGDTYDPQTHTRTINKIKKLYDVSAVDIPAYNETSISARGFFEEEHKKEFAALELERRRKLLIAQSYLF